MSSDYTPVSVTSGFEMEVTINENFNAIKTAMDKLLNRELSTDNAMEQDLDIGGFNLINLPAATAPTHPIRLGEASKLSAADVVVTATFATTISQDAVSPTIVLLTLTGNTTITMTGFPVDGKPIMFVIKQDGVGSRTVTWDGARTRFSTELPYTTSTTANKTDYVLFRYNLADDKFDMLALNKGF